MTFSDYMDYLRSKRIGVIGFGVSNSCACCSAAAAT